MVRTATSTFLGSALAVLSFFSSPAIAQGCQTLNGNTYCKQVDHIKYTNIEASGLGYSDVVKMDPSTCECKKSELTYSGKLAPLDSEVCFFIPDRIDVRESVIGEILRLLGGY